MSQPETWTIGRLLTWTTDYLKQHGSDSPRLDAEVLLAESRGCKRIELYTKFDEPADDATRTKFRELVKQRAEGKPVAYLVGRREFYSLSFRVTADVLVPRPETESLVLRLIELFKQGTIVADEPRIADIGTGSGIIAVCAAKHLPAARVTAVDASKAALTVAQENAEALGVADRIEFVESDLFAAMPAERRFHMVASNPPYVSEGEFATLSPTVRNFEPRQALVAGPSGVEVIERLIPQAAERLEPGGWLLMEISPMIEPAVRELVEQHSGFELGPTIKDLAGLPRIVQAKKTL
jgi:release factor glutamine methyltransferase